MTGEFERAKILAEALPYIQRFREKIIVVKIGGRIFESPSLLDELAKDIVLLKAVGIEPVLVHGGGPQLDQMLARLGIKAEKINGMRATDAQTMEVVEMVLAGKLNRELVVKINLAGGKAIGLSGKDGMLLVAKPHPDQKLGAVGEVKKIDAELIIQLLKNGLIPVIAPIGVDEEGDVYNINADTASGAIAGALRAEKLILLTDVEGVKDKKGNLISSLHAGQASKMIKEGEISGGMIPKINCCLDALRRGVSKAHIIDGRVPHSLLLEIFTDQGLGTEIYL